MSYVLVDVKTVDHAQAHHLCTIHNDIITQYFAHIFPLKIPVSNLTKTWKKDQDILKVLEVKYVLITS